MRNLIFIAIALITHFNIYSQPKVAEINKIKIYAVSWNAKSKLAHTIYNIKKYHTYFFQTEEIELNNMFIDYNDCVSKLSSRESLFTSDTVKKVTTKVLAELHFGNKKVISLFFDQQGNYFYANKWHKINSELYYLLFKYFSNEIVPQTTLDEAKRNYQDDFWH